MKPLIIISFLSFLALSCKKENQVCVSCVGIDNQLGFDQNTEATECHEDSLTAYRNAFEASAAKGGSGMSCSYLNQ